MFCEKLCALNLDGYCPLSWNSLDDFRGCLGFLLSEYELEGMKWQYKIEHKGVKYVWETDWDIEEWAGAWYEGVDYSWRFEVSTHGRIRNAMTKHIYSLHICSAGYLQICTSICGKNKNIRIHRCVAETFLSNTNGYEIVNHIDGNKTNNRLDNLEWCSRRDNYNHAVDMELIDPTVPYQLGQNSRYGCYRGSYNGMAKLSEDDVIYIRSNYIPKGKGQKCNRQELATYFGVSVGLISRIIKNEIWTHV